jgi:glycosyltransferase involved in cell wall biosynthesis
LPGFVRDVGAWYDRADLLAIPSHYEGFPLVGIEAMGCGLPVVAADCEGGVREMLADGECGELVRPNDVDALAAGLCKLLIDPAARRRLAERGLQRVRDFAPEQVAVKWEDLFAELLDR